MNIPYAEHDTPPTEVPYYLLWPAVIGGNVLPGVLVRSLVTIRSYELGPSALVAGAWVLPPLAGVGVSLWLADRASRKEDFKPMLTALLVATFCGLNLLFALPFALAAFAW